MKLISLIIIILTALPTFARLGETKAECETRYGKPVRTTKEGNTLYQKGGLDIVISFFQDKAVVLFFAKSKEDTPEIDIPLEGKKYRRESLTVAERETLLKANSGSSAWGEGTILDADTTCWYRADKKASAEFFRPILIIRDSEHKAYLEREEEKKKAKNLDDF
jgi:hypothetical protein